MTRLSERLQKRANGRRETTLQVSTKVNHYQSKLRDTTRKMMALISELSLQQVIYPHQYTLFHFLPLSLNHFIISSIHTGSIYTFPARGQREGD